MQPDWRRRPGAADAGGRRPGRPLLGRIAGQLIRSLLVVLPLLLGAAVVFAEMVFDEPFDGSAVDPDRWTKRDSQNLVYVRQGSLGFHGWTGVWGDPALYSANTVTRRPGRSLVAIARPNVSTVRGPLFLLAPAQFPANPPTAGYGMGIDSVGGDGGNGGRGLGVTALTPGADFVYRPRVAESIDYLLATTLRPDGGSFHVAAGGELGTFPEGTLVWVNETGTDQNLYVGVDTKKTRAESAHVKVTDFPAAFASQYGLARAFDTFGRPDGTSLGSTEGGGLAWTERAGDLQVAGGAVTRAGTAAALATVDAGTADGLFEMSFVTPGGSFADVMLYFRYRDAANWWRFRCTGSTVHLERRVGGAESIVYQTGAISCRPSTAYRLVVRAHGSHINVWLNNQSALFSPGVEDGTLQTASGFGIGFGPGAPAPAVEKTAIWPKTVTLPREAGPFAAPPNSSQQVLVRDSFSGANGTRLQSHTPELGGPWTEQGGTWTLSNGAVSLAGCCALASVETGVTDMAVTTTVRLGSGSGWGTTDGWEVGPVLRFTPGGNQIFARFLYQQGSPEIELWQMIGGRGEFLSAKNITGLVAPGQTHTLKAVAAGSRIAVYLDGRHIIDATTQVLTGTRAGIVVNDQPVVVSAFDHFEVTTVSPGGGGPQPTPTPTATPAATPTPAATATTPPAATPSPTATTPPAATPSPTATPAGAGPAVVRLTLVNADTGQDIGPLANGATLNLAALPTRNLNVRADTDPAVVGSVRFGLDGNPAYSTESVAPYAFAGDTNGDYHPWTPALGSHTLTGTPFTGAGGTGTAGRALTVSFTVTDQGPSPTPQPTATRTPAPTATRTPAPSPTSPAAGQRVTGFTLINADSDTPIRPLANGDTVSLSGLPTRNLNIRAETSPSTVGSVRFGLDGNPAYSTESVAPYAFAGDTNGDYHPWTPALGTHPVSAVPYTGPGATGAAGTPLAISFTVTN